MIFFAKSYLSIIPSGHYLKDSQELYQDCEFISKKTRSIYAWRAALWVRYCKEQDTDFIVTEDRLIRYLDWLFEIDLVHKINTKKSYVPDILRDHIGSIICLWRIQTGNDPDLVSPKEGTRYQAKWDEILRNYPRRERFQPRSYLPDGIRGIDSGVGTPGMGSAVSPHMHSAFPHGFGSDAPSYHYHHHHPYQKPQPQPQQPQQPVLPPLQKQQHQRQFPVGLSEPAELGWQLGWMQNCNWAPTTARVLFTIAVSAWVDAVDVVGMRLSDIHFASSTMAPRLPSSVLRLSLVTNTASGVRTGGQGLSPANAGTRQQFSVIRSRNPLLCSWNALAAVLFYRWHVAGSPPPTFADTSWHSTLVISGRSSDSASPLTSGSRRGSGLSDAAMESGYVSVFERLNLVRDLLPDERLPMERIVRMRSLHRARQSSLHGAGSGGAQRDSRFARGGYGFGATDCSLAPLADSESPDRLYALSIANSGYYEPHHSIQRHKVIPPESLQHTIFPWASTMMNTVPSNVSVDERRNISRFLDFLLDLRIVLLQDMAILKCCAGQLPREFEPNSILCNQLFSTPEFSKFCNVMRSEAAEEIRVLQQDLEAALSGAESHRNSNPGTSDSRGAAAAYCNSHQRSPGSMSDSQGVMLPPISSLGQRDDSTMMGSPGEPFSPTISPSPPIPPQQRDKARNSMPFLDSPRSSDSQMQQPATQSMSQQHATARQAPLSHSMPNRLLDNWPCDSGSGFGAGPTTAMLSSARRRRPDYGGGILPPPPALAMGPGSPRTRSSPQGLMTFHHPQRMQKSPNMQNSPTISIIGGMTSTKYGAGFASGAPQSATQFAQSPVVTASPMQVSTPPIAGGIGSQQRSGPPSGGMRGGPDAYPPLSARRGDEQINGDSTMNVLDYKDEFPRTESEQISYLREENAYLRSRLQRLEATVQQKQAEVQSWMDRIERYVSRNNERPPL
ncbi:hypothetical protein GQ54DRAFT_330121 [Martensiomyces pterosporus]|nr:hypothetical protein GQ54DRAFT_330121 [Martensiomyces pterosporus]